MNAGLQGDCESRIIPVDYEDRQLQWTNWISLHIIHQYGQNMTNHKDFTHSGLNLSFQ